MRGSEKEDAGSKQVQSTFCKHSKPIQKGMNISSIEA